MATKARAATVEEPGLRLRLARAYTGLAASAALVVVVQAVLFGGFYDEFDEAWLDAHEGVAFISTVVAVVIWTPLGFLARFSKGLRIGWLTLVLAALWVAQLWLGYAIEDNRATAAIHIPLAVLLFGLAVYLVGKASGALRAVSGK